MSIDVFNPPLRTLSSATVGTRRTHLLREIEHENATRSSRPRVRRSTLILAFVIAGLLAATAYAVVQEVILGSSAPSTVKQSEQQYARTPRLGIPFPSKAVPRSRGMVVAKTTAVAITNGPAGPAYLWASPNRLGGYCLYVQIVGADLPNGTPNLMGGCPSPPDHLVIQRESVHGRMVGILEAHLTVPGARSLEVRFSDGTSRVFTITNDFVLAYVNPSLLISISSAVARDALGHAVAVDPNKQGTWVTVHNTTRRAPAVYHGTRKPTSLAEIRAQDRTSMRLMLLLSIGKYISLPIVATFPEIGTRLTMVERGGPFAAPGIAEQICNWLNVPGAGSSDHCRLLDDLPNPTALDLSVQQDRIGQSAIVVLWGPVGADLHSLELRFQDGTHVNIPIHHGYVLYQVNPSTYASGHQPTTFVGRNASGKTVITAPFLPGYNTVRRAPAAYNETRKPISLAEIRAQDRASQRLELLLFSKYTSLPIVATLPEIGTHRTIVLRSGPFAAPGIAEQICTWLIIPGAAFPGAATGGSCQPLDDPLGPTELNIGPTQSGIGQRAFVVLAGPVGADIHSLELLFQDGTHVNIPIHHGGYVVYQINPATYASGHQPITFIGRNASGKTVITAPFSQA